MSAGFWHDGSARGGCDEAGKHNRWIILRIEGCEVPSAMLPHPSPQAFVGYFWPTSTPDCDYFDVALRGESGPFLQAPSPLPHANEKGVFGARLLFGRPWSTSLE